MSLLLRYPLNGTDNDVIPENTAQPQYASGVTLVDDEVLGKVAQFDGTSTAYVLGPTLTFETTARTVSYWLYANSDDISFAHGSGRWWQTAMSWGTIVDYRGLRFGMHTEHIISAIPTREWIHVCETYDGSTMSQYFDGNLVNSLNASFSNAPLPLYLGMNEAYKGLYNLDGRMSDFRVYDYALSAAEVQKTYSVGANVVAAVEIPGTMQVSSRGSTSISILVEGDPNVDYNVVVADQVVDNVKSGDTVIIRDLEPSADYDCQLFKTV